MQRKYVRQQNYISNILLEDDLFMSLMVDTSASNGTDECSARGCGTKDPCVLPFLRLVSILAYTTDVFATESVTVVRGKR